ncbi:MAG: pyridine nucleotide-disulfide oxidoreductase, partial [Lachnospiraceae bacterium]|nr:pyridine nucleotide-disulfide oxidoreductase [Lachnospiraceae bacterium]
EGTKGMALGRNGQPVCEATVVSVKTSKAFDKTNLLTMRVPKEYAMKARFFRAGEQEGTR